MKYILTLLSIFICYNLAFAIKWEAHGPAGIVWFVTSVQDVKIAIASGGAYTRKDDAAPWKHFKSGSMADWQVYAVCKSDSDVFVATNRNIFKSTDKGNTWTSDSSYITHASVYSLAYSDGILYAGAEESVYWSSNKGKSWQTTPLDDIYVQTICAKDGVIYAPDSWGACICKSTDKGQTWKAIKIPDSLHPHIRSLCVYGDDLVAATNSGLIKSSDDAATWSVYNSNLNDSNIIYLYPHSSGLYAVTNTGKILKLKNETDSPILDTLGLNGTIALSVYSVKDTLYAATTKGVFRKRLDDAKWLDASQNISGAYIYTLFADDSCVIASNGGTYLSRDNGDTWRFISPLTFSCFTKSCGTIIGGTNDSGAYRSDDHGETWVKVSKDLRDTKIIDLTSLDSIVFAATANGFYLSTDCGYNWEYRGGSGWVMSIIYDGQKLRAASPGGPSNRDGTFSLSYDKGKTFTTTTFWLPSLFSFYKHKNVIYTGAQSRYLMKIYENNNFEWVNVSYGDVYVRNICGIRNYVFASVGKEGVSISYDSISNWGPINDGLYNAPILRVASNSTRVFAASSGRGVFVMRIPETIVAPKLIAPFNTTINTSANLNFKWTSIEDARSYEIQLSRDSSFNQHTKIYSFPDSIGLISNLLFETKYFWRARGIFGSVKGDWSDSYTFTTGDATNVDLDEGEFITISPNPAQENLKINYKFNETDPVKISIYDLLGEKLVSFTNLNPQNIIDIDVSKINCGSLKVVVEIGNRKLNKSVLISR